MLTCSLLGKSVRKGSERVTELQKLCVVSENKFRLVILCLFRGACRRQETLLLLIQRVKDFTKPLKLNIKGIVYQKFKFSHLFTLLLFQTHMTWKQKSFDELYWSNGMNVLNAYWGIQASNRIVVNKTCFAIFAKYSKVIQ